MKKWKEEIKQYDETQTIYYNSNTNDLVNTHGHQVMVDYTVNAEDKHRALESYSVSDAIMDIIAKQNNGDGDIDLDDYNAAQDYDDMDHKIYKKRDTDPYRMGSYYFHKVDPINHQYEVVIFYNSTAF
jgi:hypothetical protein